MHHSRKRSTRPTNVRTKIKERQPIKRHQFETGSQVERKVIILCWIFRTLDEYEIKMQLNFIALTITDTEKSFEISILKMGKREIWIFDGFAQSTINRAASSLFWKTINFFSSNEEIMNVPFFCIAHCSVGWTITSTQCNDNACCNETSQRQRRLWTINYSSNHRSTATGREAHAIDRSAARFSTFLTRHTRTHTHTHTQELDAITNCYTWELIWNPFEKQSPIE